MIDAETATIPFASLAQWLRDHHFLLTDKQTCLRLCAFMMEHASKAGVTEEQVQQRLRDAYHPRRRVS